MSHSHEAPGLPQVTDEAGDSPAWLPKLGGALLLAVFVLVAAAQLRSQPQTPAPSAPAGADGAAE